MIASESSIRQVAEKEDAVGPRVLGDATTEIGEMTNLEKDAGRGHARPEVTIIIVRDLEMEIREGKTIDALLRTEDAMTERRTSPMGVIRVMLRTNVASRR